MQMRLARSQKRESRLFMQHVLIRFTHMGHGRIQRICIGRTVDAQWTPNGRPVDAQWTPSGHPVDAQWTPQIYNKTCVAGVSQLYDRTLQKSRLPF